MNVYRVTHPRWDWVTLRVLVYHPTHEPEGMLKLVVQVWDPTRGPVAEAPLLEELLMDREVDAYLQDSRADGWVFQREATPVAGISKRATQGLRQGAA